MKNKSRPRDPKDLGSSQPITTILESLDSELPHATKIMQLLCDRLLLRANLTYLAYKWPPGGDLNFHSPLADKHQPTDLHDEQLEGWLTTHSACVLTYGACEWSELPRPPFSPVIIR